MLEFLAGGKRKNYNQEAPSVSKGPKPLLSGTTPRIRQAAAAGRRSILYQWMLANFEEFRATLAAAGRPNWSELAKAFAEEKLWDRRNRPPTAEGSRQTWWLVRRAVAKDLALAEPVSSPGRANAPAPTPPQGTPADAADDDFRPMTLTPLRKR